MRELKTKAQVKNKNCYKIIPTPWYKSTTPCLSNPPSFMITVLWTLNSWYKWDSLINVEVWGMMKYSIYPWDLVWSLESASPASCKTPATFDSIRQKNSLEKKKEPRNQIQLPTNIACCLGLHTQKLEPIEVDLEPNPKGGSDKINLMK